MQQVCGVCQKGFATIASLHRHERNHASAGRYRCSICSLMFVRQDLLRRHVSIHDSETTTTKRARTACSACRTARAKCSGQTPCQRCQTKHLECTFNYESSGRTSKGPGMTTSTSPTTEAVTELSQNRAPDEIDPRQLCPDDQLLFPNFPSISPQSTTWPWLHENLYLGNDISLDFFEPPSRPTNVDTISSTHDNATIDEQVGAGLIEQGLVTTVRDSTKSKEEVIESLVSCATCWTKSLGNVHSSFDVDLVALCFDVVTAFDLNTNNDTGNCLDQFIKLYEEHFWPLWPLIPQFEFQGREFQPFLHLAMASIGSMYGGRKSANFGTMLHNRLRDELINPFFDHEVATYDLICLGQARSLTQAAALYFGQRRAFSYAQHIGAILVAQGRRMNLFSMSPLNSTEPANTDSWLDGWIRKESKKRLAFAILRLEMYTSVLHGTRPLISGEELDIELPCSRYVWHTKFESAKAFIAAINQDAFTHKPRPLFSDLVRIASDPAEPLPYLDTLDQELLFNAVQERVWAGCMAKDSVQRLTGYDAYSLNLEERRGRDDILQQSDISTTPSLDSHLARQPRTMESLRRRLDESTDMLTKCHNSLRSTGSQLSAWDRTSLLSCLLVYHLAHVQLQAPIDTIHSICHASSSDESKIARVTSWSSSSAATKARGHATSIYHLLRSEADKDCKIRASVNFLTMIGLYHSAVLLWVLARAREAGVCSIAVSMPSPVPEPAAEDFVRLYHDINPAWAVRSSFCAAVQQLANSVSPFSGRLLG